MSGLGPLYSSRKCSIAKLVSPQVMARSCASSKPILFKPARILSGRIDLPNWAYSAGEGMATVYLNLLRSPKGSVNATMASFGQVVMHSPQSMHFSFMMIAFPFRIRIACVGQTRMHFIRPSHFSASTIIEWKYWFTRSLSNSGK